MDQDSHEMACFIEDMLKATVNHATYQEDHMFAQSVACNMMILYCLLRVVILLA